MKKKRFTLFITIISVFLKTQLIVLSVEEAQFLYISVLPEKEFIPTL